MKCKAIRASERAVRAYATLVTIGMLALMVSGCFTPVDVRVETPVFSPSAGTYSTDQSVEISCETTDAVIFYTTDGAVPTTQSTPYTESIQVDGHGTVVTIMAIAALDGLADSEVAEATYTIDYGPVSTPRFSPGQGTYFSLQSIVISCSTPEATIRYTSDGSTPGTTEGTVYAGPITLDADATLKAIAYKTGRESSEVATAVYTVFVSPHLDTGFGTGGSVTTDIASTDEGGTAVAIQSDGKIVVAGPSEQGSTNRDFAVVRYNTDGSLDTGFGSGGIVTTAFGVFNFDYPRAVAIQADGGIVVTGTSEFLDAPYKDFALARYTIAGALDTSFDSDGLVNTDISSNRDEGFGMAIQSDGDIVVAGLTYNGSNEDFAVMRYTTVGNLDADFGTDGIVTTAIGSEWDGGQAVALQSDGQIIVAGYANNGSDYDFAIVRYNATGSLDTSFDTDGIVTTDFGSADDDFAYAVAVQSDNRIVVVGTTRISSDRDIALARYNTNGTLDTGFGSGGLVTTDFGWISDLGTALAIQSDGKIVVVGYTDSSGDGTDHNIIVARYTASGVLDTDFDSDGMLVAAIGSGHDRAAAVAIQSDGKIVVAGSSDNGTDLDIAVMRFTPE